jgi:fatty-acyl-CoA synthase
MGSVLHTANLRLGAAQLARTVRHAGDTVLVFDSDQAGLVEEVAAAAPGVRTFVMIGEGEQPAVGGRQLIGYEDVIAAGRSDYEFPDLDEKTAAGMCFTSATTGDPKGVLYSHRSIVLHTLGLCVHGSIGVREGQVILPISPMFHVNSWGIPYACVLQGSRIVLPGRHPSALDHLLTIEEEQVNVAVAAVTVGIAMRNELERATRRFDLSSLQTLWLGGQAPPSALIAWWAEQYGVEVPQGWGMTETSPLLTFTSPKRADLGAGGEVLERIRSSQGLPLPLVELKLVDEEGKTIPWDGKSIGELWVRGPWVASAYYEDDRSAESFIGGWFRTGDLAVVDPGGYVHLVDRVKDLIKSGGEWISSVELEHALMAHPAVREAAVVAVPHETWIERPLAVVAAEEAIGPEELRQFLAPHFPRWWLPDEFVFVDEVPKTGVGKFDKKRLRAQYGASVLGREHVDTPSGFSKPEDQ